MPYYTKKDRLDKQHSNNNPQPQQQPEGIKPRQEVTGSNQHLYGYTLSPGRSERRALSLEENGRDNPTSKYDSILFGMPGVSVVRTRDLQFNTDSGWYEV